MENYQIRLFLKDISGENLLAEKIMIFDKGADFEAYKNKFTVGSTIPLVEKSFFEGIVERRVRDACGIFTIMIRPNTDPECEQELNYLKRSKWKFLKSVPRFFKGGWVTGSLRKGH